jgi:hypothetical protein
VYGDDFCELRVVSEGMQILISRTDALPFPLRRDMSRNGWLCEERAAHHMQFLQESPLPLRSQANFPSKCDIM